MARGDWLRDAYTTTLTRLEAPKENRPRAVGSNASAAFGKGISRAEESSCLSSGDGVCGTGSGKHSRLTDTHSILFGLPHHRGVFIHSPTCALHSAGTSPKWSYPIQYFPLNNFHGLLDISHQPRFYLIPRVVLARYIKTSGNMSQVKDFHPPHATPPGTVLHIMLQKLTPHPGMPLYLSTARK